MSRIVTRRALLSAGAIGAGGVLSGCDTLSGNAVFQDVLSSAEQGNFLIQRALGDRMELASEYSLDDLSAGGVLGNGTRNPDTPAYNRSAAQNFADWTLKLTGMVTHPAQFSLDSLRSMPKRTQITRHDCVEGWSAIGQWTGVPLKILLDVAVPLKSAKYLVFHCADMLGGRPYYETIDMLDAYHPQTMLAYGLNNESLPIANGAPLRLRVERQLGYKHAKYVYGIEVTDDLSKFGAGKGGYWEDVANYEWYAGI